MKKRVGVVNRVLPRFVGLAFVGILAPAYFTTFHYLREQPVGETWGRETTKAVAVERSLTPRIPSAWLTLGEELFIRQKTAVGANNEGSTARRQLLNKRGARENCHRVDELKVTKELQQSSLRSRVAKDDSTSDDVLFTDCMNDLERSQRDFRASFPDFDSRTCSESEQELIHTVWDVKGGDKRLPPTALLGILSMVLSYPRGCVKVTVWVTNTKTKDIVQSELKNHLSGDTFEVEILDFGSLCDRIAEVHPSLAESLALARPKLARLDGGPEATTDFAAYSDIIRVFVLAAFGGVYLDCDMVVLRPLTPLLSHDFYYRWSFHPYANTAAMHLQLGSMNSYRLIQLVLDQASWYPNVVLGSVMGHSIVYPVFEKRIGHSLHPEHLYEALQKTNGTVQLLPSSYFDPVWMIDEGYCDSAEASSRRYGISTFRDQFFQQVNSNPAVHEDVRANFFPGAFAFHFHNQWQSEFLPGSSADLLMKQFVEQGRGREANKNQTVGA